MFIVQTTCLQINVLHNYFDMNENTTHLEVTQRECLIFNGILGKLG